jgi:ActR/RegA family two-component response regulator
MHNKILKRESSDSREIPIFENEYYDVLITDSKQYKERLARLCIARGFDVNMHTPRGCMEAFLESYFIE